MKLIMNFVVETGHLTQFASSCAGL